MHRFGLVAALALAGTCCAPAQETPANVIDQIQGLDWKAVLADPETRGFLSSLIYRVLPESWRGKVTEEQIADGLAALIEEYEKLPAGLSEKQKLAAIADALVERLFPGQMEKLDEQIEKALESLPDFIKLENGHYVITLEKAGSLRIKYEQNAYRGITTIFNPVDPIKRGAILLSAEKLRLDIDGKHLDAEGNVVLRDDHSSLIARQIHYDAPTRSLAAESLSLRLPSVKFDAGQFSDGNGVSKLQDANFRATVIGVPVVKATASEVEIDGMLGQARNVKVNVFGIPVWSRDFVDFRLDSSGRHIDPHMSLLERLKRLAQLATLLKPPSVNFFGKTPSVSYQNQYAFGNRQMIQFGMQAQRDQLFASEGMFSWNLSADPSSDPSILSTSYVKEDFLGGYVQNAGVRTMADFVNSYRQPRRTFAIGYSYNQRVELRDVEDLTSRPVILAYEFGGPIGNFGAIGQVRYEQAKSRTLGQTEQRAVLFGSLGLFAMEPFRGVSVNGRLDAAAYKPKGEGYAWIRPVLSVQARLLPQVFLSGAYVNGREFGTPFSISEQYLAGPEYHARLDINIGPTQFTYANRYSVRERSWYRSQIYIAQDIDAFQLYIQTDQQLSRFSFGVSLRLEEILDNLRSRRYTGVSLDRPQTKK